MKTKHIGVCVASGEFIPQLQATRTPGIAADDLQDISSSQAESIVLDETSNLHVTPQALHLKHKQRRALQHPVGLHKPTPEPRASRSLLGKRDKQSRIKYSQTRL